LAQEIFSQFPLAAYISVDSAMNCLRLALLSMTWFSVIYAETWPISPEPNDSYWSEQWYLDNRDAAGQLLGVDMNARGAWAVTKGQGITIAIVDDGVDLVHPDLSNRARADLHWNFQFDQPDGNHPTNFKMHGTAVAGLAAAEGNNQRGVSGMAPEATFASWVIYRTNNSGDPFVNSNQLAKMFRYRTDEVQIQNHSWAKPPGDSPIAMSIIESEAIEDAVRNGREGKGVIMVRAAGNERLRARNVNDDAYLNDVRAIAVAGLRPDGVVSGYSNPGAPILVAAPGGEEGIASLFTTDRVGTRGYNFVSFTNDLSDYVFASLGFVGTSAAAPLVSGTVALMLSRNPALTYRDVQQVLLLSARQTHLDDPDLQTNAAGLLVGHNAGYGLGDAATAVHLAGQWRTRPPLAMASVSVDVETPLEDGSLTLAAAIPGLPLIRFPALPSLGVHVDGTTPSVPLVYVGDAAQPLAVDLSGKGALIRRGATNFYTKIRHAAEAGALFAAIFNNEGTNFIQVMGGTDYAPIPAIAISQRDGDQLTNALERTAIDARIQFDPTVYEFPVSDTLICEHVKVTVRVDHPQRGDLRIVLISPLGTRSVLQRLGTDLAPFPGEWTYTSAQHFFEPSAGTWRLIVADQAQEGTGILQGARLEILGVPIVDGDRDGLDDDWERDHLGGLTFSAKDDPDEDGYSNAREQVLGVNPRENDRPLALSLSRWNPMTIRLSWPGRNGVRYEVLAGERLNEPLILQDEVEGEFPRVDWFAGIEERFHYFLVREKP
jgi:subtilisin family serine protease/subtilisin-like proprotein convertase family protein